MCTLEKRANIFVLTLTGGDTSDEQHRLNPSTIAAILSALSQAKSQSSRGSVLITTTTAGSKFFCNGFDLSWARSAGSPSGAADRLRHMVASFKPVVSALLDLPMPTIAAITGHAAAAGFLFALCHDYIIVRKDRGVLYMSEVDIGLSMPGYVAAMFRARIGAFSGKRDVLLAGRKVRGEEAVAMGIAEEAHDSAEKVVEASVRMGERLAARGWDGEVYASIRKSLYPEVCQILGLESKTFATPRSKL